MNRSHPILPFGLGVLMVLAGACSTRNDTPAPVNTGSADVALDAGLDSRSDTFDRLVPPGTSVEVLARGFAWAEGPVWIPGASYLLFTDPPNNRIHAWSEAQGSSVWLEPSGYFGDDPSRTNAGANGLLLDAQGRLVMCQHGERRVARLDTPPTTEPDSSGAVFTVLADSYEGRRLNSPNDAAYGPDGSLWFTDPPYGLPDGDASAEKEIPFNGVYRLAADGSLTVVTDTLTRPNGVAFSPDGRTAYVANSDPERAWWGAYDLAEDGSVTGGRLFHDATALVSSENPGLPDGLKVDGEGNVFATGPGGVLVFSPAGELLGTIRTGDAAANVAFGDNGETLYITASSRLLRVRR